MTTAVRKSLRGMKRHSRRDRERTVEEMMPLMKHRFGRNLAALAAQGSYARGEDFWYSDLELIAFLKRYTKAQQRGGMGKIGDGLLVECTTRDEYLKRVREGTAAGHIAGSDQLLPIITKPYIEAVNRYTVKDFGRKCLQQLAHQWNEVQETASKTLNAVGQSNRQNLPLRAFDMYRHLLRALSLLNRRPYTTFGRFVTQARSFKTKPGGFDRLTDIIVRGRFDDLRSLEKAVITTFAGFEELLAARGVDPCRDNIDPAVPADNVPSWL